MVMWKRSGKRTGPNYKIGREEKQQGGARTKSKEGEDQAENPVHAGMGKWKMEDEQGEQEAKKSVEQATLSREFERGMAGRASNFV